MQTPIRYTVVNQGGQPVIRAVPVPRRNVRATSRTRQEQPTRTESTRHPLLRRIRRLGFRQET